MTFGTIQRFRDVVTLYDLKNGFDLTIDRSDKSRNRVAVKCKDQCKFLLYVSWDKKNCTYVLRTTNNDHKCNRNMLRNRQLKSAFVARFYLLVFKARPDWPAKEMREELKRDFGIIVKRSFCYSVKQQAHKLLHGSMKDHYSKLGRYLEELKRTSSSSTFLLQTDRVNDQPIPVFQRLFTCFDGLRQGLIQGCRPIMCIDACFLKTFLEGVLMTAIGIDGNNQMFPIAWAICEGENHDSWVWFLQNVQSCLQVIPNSSWTILLDEHVSIILHAVPIIYPDVEHRHCARHIYSNWKKTHKGEELKLLFWNTTKAYNEADYKDALEALAKEPIQAAQDFVAYNPRVFCRAFMKTNTKCDVIMNNMAETLNAYIVDARAKHCIDMLEDIRVALMQQMVTKKAVMEKIEDEICPGVRKQLETEKENSRFCEPFASEDMKFQVNHGIDSLIVDMRAATCTCRKWDLTGIPCCYAISCANMLRREAEEFVHPFFKRAKYLRVYAGSISPLAGERHWPQKHFLLDPPPVRIMPGRPRKKRRRQAHEDPKRPGKLTKHGVEMMCSNCGFDGHNRRSCTNPPTSKSTTAKRPRGRPRKHPQQPTNGQSHAGRGRGRGRGRGARREAGLGSGSGRGSGAGGSNGAGNGGSQSMAPQLYVSAATCDVIECNSSTFGLLK